MRLKLSKGGPERWLMIGVAGLGAYAAYRLVLAPKGPSTAFDLPNPGGPNGPSGGTYARPNDFHPGPEATAVLGDTLALGQGRTYGFVVDTNAPDYPGGDPITALTAFGFGQAARFQSTSVASHVPPYALTTTSPTAFWGVATWGQPTQKKARPAWLPLLWSTFPAPAQTLSRFP